MAFQLKLARRLQEIVAVFTVAGFGDLFRSCRMTPNTSVRFSWNGPSEEGDDPGERREAVEDFLSKYGGTPMGLKDLAAMVAMQPALQAVIDRRTETHRSRSIGAHVDRPR